MKCKACGCEYNWVEIGDDFCICECGHEQEVLGCTKIYQDKTEEEIEREASQKQKEVYEAKSMKDINFSNEEEKHTLLNSLIKELNRINYQYGQLSNKYAKLKYDYELLLKII